MALVLDPALLATVTFMDRDRNKSTVKLHYPSATAYADILASLTTLVGLMDPLSNAIITEYKLSTVYKDDAFLLADIPEASDVERKGVWVLKATNGQISKLELPSVDNTYVVDGSNVLNDQNVDVLAFSGALILGNIGPANGPVTNTGADLTVRLGAIRKIHRGSQEG